MQRSVLILLVVAAIALFAGLGRGAITDSDEAYYAEASREMVETGDLLTPRYNYADRFQKPVLYYWCAAAAFVAAGTGEAAARFPSALSGLGLTVLAWLVGRRWFDGEAGWLAGAIIATCLGTAAMARLALPDLPLAFLITLSIVAGFTALLDGDGLRIGPLLLSAAASGAAFLTKGPVGLALPVIVLAPLVVAERRWRQLRPGPVALAALVWALVGCTWYVAMTRVHGAAYLRSFFVGDNLERFATSRFNSPRPVWFYAPILLGGLLPWSAFTPLWIPTLVRWARRVTAPSRSAWRLMAWTLLPLALFTASIGKQPRYILPVLPPLAIALAVAIRRRLAERPGQNELLFSCCAMAGGVAIAVIGVLVLGVPAEATGIAPSAVFAAGCTVAVAGIAVIATTIFHRRLVPFVMAVASVLLIVSLEFGLLSQQGPETVQQVASEVRARLAPGVRWTTDDVFVRNLVFYVGQRESGPFDEPPLVEFLNDGPALAVMSESNYRRLAPLVSTPLRVVGRWEYFDVAAVRVGVVVDQSFQRQLKAIVLVSNRPEPAAR